MTKPVTGSLPNLINGISQQAPALRLPTQGEAQENFYSTIVEGLKGRPPTEYVAKLLSSLPANAWTHIINRDTSERYIVVFDSTSGHIRVFDFAGSEKTVSAPNGWSYLSGMTSPNSQLTAVTIADFTFITNKTVTAAMTSSTPTVRKPEALVNVLAGNYGKTYNIIINGTTVGTKTTSTTSATDIDTVQIAKDLVTSLGTNNIDGAHGWTVTRYGNAVHIQRTDTTDFTITVEDGYNGNAMKAIKDRTQRFTDLPGFSPDGFVTQITGDNDNVFNSYWVKAQADAAGTIIWKETVKPGVKLNLDATTMPHTLVRNSDGTFTFDQATWDPRKCGDTTGSPDPSFVGQKIEKAFFHRNRLGILAEENAILSRNGSFFDFFRTSMTAVLDDDPIDVADTHTKVSILHHAIPYQDLLVLFSDQTQFTLTGNDQLTPKTASIKPRTEYVSDPLVPPIGLAQAIYFASKRGDYAAIWEWTIDRISQVADATEVTEHAPKYIPAGVYKLIGTSNESFLGVLTTGDAGALYAYKYYTNKDGQRLQAAWQRWSFNGATVLNAEFVDNVLYVVLERSDGVYLEQMRVHPNVVDTNLNFVVLLDQRINTSMLAAPSYSAVSNTTTYTLPFTPATGITAVTDGSDPVISCQELVVSSINAGAKTVTLAGDTRTRTFWFGYRYTRTYTFSRFYLRQPSQSGGTQTVQSGRLQIQRLTLSFDKAAYFQVVVTPLGQTPYTYNWSGRILGSPDNVLGVVPLVSGKKSIPIYCRNDRVTVQIVTDSWMPSSFISAEWFGTFNEKAATL